MQILVARAPGPLSPSAVKSLAILFGYGNSSFWDQYLRYWSQLFHGNLGISFTYFPVPVVTIIAQDLPWTVALIGLCTVISFLIGTGLGMVVGWKRGSPLLESLLPVTTFFSSIPYFWLGLVCVFVFGVELGWFPINGAYSASTTVGLSFSFVDSAIYHALLPGITIVLASLAGWVLGMRNMMVTTLGEDYVLMAEAEGLAPSRVMFVYAARNAVLPSIASFALSLGFIVSGAVLVETVFSYPGIGYALFEAVSNEDFPLMQGIFLTITLAVLIANFAADLVYVILDPRTRAAA